jgi:hypothetical protein
MKVFFCVAIGMTLSVAAFADGSNVGSQAATWLDLPDSARTAAMGGASVALADDVNTLSVNPAGLGGLMGQQVSLMHNDYVQDTSLEHVAYGLGLGSSDGVGVSLDYMNYGSIPTNTVSNGELVATGSSINPYGDSFDVGYGHSFGNVLIGATLELVTENLIGGSTNAAVGGDFGILWRQDPTDGLSAGLAVQNLGSQLDGADLPTNYQAGLAYRISLLDGRQCLAFAGDASVPEAELGAESLALGAEYSGNSLWAIRGGYKFVGDNGVGGLSVGGGLRYQIASIDYAFVSEGALGDANQISLSAKF